MRANGSECPEVWGNEFNKRPACFVLWTRCVLRDACAQINLPTPCPSTSTCWKRCLTVNCLQSFFSCFIRTAQALATMRAALLALGCYAAIVSADVSDSIESVATEATSSVESAVESVTSSAHVKPTFTVRYTPYFKSEAPADITSQPLSRHLSLSSSPMVLMARDGRPHTRRRRTLMRSGNMSAPGVSRSPPC